MGKPQAPTPPDPVKTATAQTGTNIGTAIAQQGLNNVNQVTPFGTLEYEQSGTNEYTDPVSGETYEIPSYTATQTLSEQQQQISDKSQESQLNLANLGANQSSRLDEILSRPMSLDGLPQRADLSGLSSQSGMEGRQRVEDALLERMNPSLDRGRENLEQRLASQGIRIGSEAYENAMGDQGRQENDARLAAILGAGNEQNRQVGLDVQIANAQDSSRGRAMQEEFAIRNQPINEISALMGGSQLQSPGFVNPRSAQIPTTDFAGIEANAHNQAMSSYNSKMGSWNNIFGGALGLGANLMLSDERTKEDIKKVGKTDDGQNVYTYRYKSGGPTQMGLMAQEVEKKKPGAVAKVNGLRMVNYERAVA